MIVIDGEPRDADRLARVVAVAQADGAGVERHRRREQLERRARLVDALGDTVERRVADGRGRLVGIEIAKDCLDIFLKTPFGGDRHQRRVDKLTAPKFEGVEA